MTTEFNIGDEVWYGYPNPEKGVIKEIKISESGIWYVISGSPGVWSLVSTNSDEALLKGLKSDLESHERYIAKLKLEIAELETHICQTDMEEK